MRWLYLLLFLTACSVGTSLNGISHPDFDEIYIGAPKSNVTSILGRHVKSERVGRAVVYEYKYPAFERSFLEAGGNLLMTVGTLGAWEKSDFEDSNKKSLFITYDKYWNIETINAYIR